MKVILSRKGFDSQYGGYPSPILPDGRMISLPIPFNDKFTYNDLRVSENLTYFDLMKQLNSRIKYNYKWHILTENTQCHPDPDINSSAMKRNTLWKPLFGQTGAAQAHLDNPKNKVAEDDLFLFFGTFRKTLRQAGMYQFDLSPEFHAIYGYLQIGEIIPVNSTEYPKWMDYHPHTNNPSRFGRRNTIYVARDRLTWQPDMPGAGLLSFNKKQILTKMGYSKSRWNLPPFLKEVKISYHSEKSWKKDYFQSAGRGQEFVIHCNKKIENWIKDILKKD